MPLVCYRVGNWSMAAGQAPCNSARQRGCGFNACLHGAALQHSRGALGWMIALKARAHPGALQGCSRRPRCRRRRRSAGSPAAAPAPGTTASPPPPCKFPFPHPLLPPQPPLPWSQRAIPRHCSLSRLQLLCRCQLMLALAAQAHGRLLRAQARPLAPRHAGAPARSRQAPESRPPAAAGLPA